MFSKPDVQKWFQPYIFTQLYTDVIPLAFYAPELRSQLAKDSARQAADAQEVNVPFMQEVFGTLTLPLYAVVEPELDGRIRVVGVYDQGLIRDEGEFIEFLKNPK